MLFHWPHFYCVGEAVHYHPTKCINYFGHRKFLVNPRKVEAIQVHRPIEPKEGGVDLNVTVAHMNHFQVMPPCWPSPGPRKFDSFLYA